MPSNILELKNLLVKRSEVFTLDIPDFQIKQGTVLGLVGNNGAGKTTLLQALLDLLTCSCETLKFFNMGWKTKALEIKKQLGVFLDETYMIDYLTGHEFFNFLKEVFKTNPVNFESRKSALLEKLSVENNEKVISQLSAGNKVKVGLIGSLLHNPKLVIWDEPFANLDAWSRNQLIEIITTFNKEEGMSFLISSHNIDELYAYSNHFLCLSEGKVILNAPKNNLSKAEILESLGVTISS